MAYKGKKRWHILPQTVDDPIEQILLNRKINLEEKESFLNPNFETDLHDPFLLIGMAEAVQRISQAKKNNELVGIFADYDADGVTSGTLLHDLLAKLGIKSIVYIPSREEGYGLNEMGINFFMEKSVTLMIAVDMGVTGKKEINYAHKLGIDTIVIDHHLVQKDKLPSGIVINPRQTKDQYPYKDLSACGLVYKLAWAVHQNYPDIISKAQLKWWLDIVAISTIADMVPLVGENRVLAFYGLQVLKKTRRLGLIELYQSAGINSEKIGPGIVGFQIAPRLNAPGRIDHANYAFALLTASDRSIAQKLAQKIQELNSVRQKELERILYEAREMINKSNLSDKKIIFLANQGWQPGLVGLVAGRLMEEFARPAIVLEKGQSASRGSARSIATFHLLDAFEHVSSYLKTFGGHARAGGLALENDHLESVYDLLLEYAETKIKQEDLVPMISVDFSLSVSGVSLQLAQSIRSLEPFGFGNPRPLFMIKSLLVNQVTRCGKENRHLKLKLGNLSAIYFDGATKKEIPKIGDVIDIVAAIEINDWNNNQRVELNLTDWQIGETS